MQKIKYPFRLVEAFIIDFHLHRLPQIPDSINIDFSASIRVHAQDYPARFQVDLRLQSETDTPLEVVAEIIGLFEQFDTSLDADEDTLRNFVEDRAVFLLWPYLAQMIRMVTGQMGMNPLRIMTPAVINISELQMELKKGK